MHDTTEPDGTVLDELGQLRAESRTRQAELARIAAELPAVASRRAIVAEMLRDLTRAPEKATVLRRVVVKILRTPADLLRRP